MLKLNDSQILSSWKFMHEVLEEWEKMKSLNIATCHKPLLMKVLVDELAAANEVPWEKAKTVNLLADPHRTGQRYFFLHIPRCGGSSIKSIIKNHSNINAVIPNAFPNRAPDEVAHISPRRDTQDWFSFGAWTSTRLDVQGLRKSNIKTITSIRNPYSWLTSYYFYGPSTLNIEDETIFTAVCGGGNVRRYFATFKDFFDFFTSDVKDSDPLSFLKPFRENPFFQLYDEQDRIYVDDFIKIENFNEDFNRCFEMNLIEEPRLNKGSASKSYKNYYDTAMQKKFESKYGFLLEEFDYSFDG